MSGRKVILVSGTILAGLFGWQYYQIYRAFLQLRVGFNRLRITLIQRDFIRIMIYLNVENQTDTDIYFNRIDLNLYLNNRYAGKLMNPYQQIVRRKNSNIIAFSVDLLYSTLGDEMFNIFKNGSNYPITLSINGKAFFNGLPVPVPDVVVQNFKLDNITDLF